MESIRLIQQALRRFRVEDPNGGHAEFAWEQLFVGSPTEMHWADDTAWQTLLRRARGQVVEDLQNLVNQTVFNRTYFALEEAGFAYPCLPAFDASREALAPFDALIRVLGDNYRYLPNHGIGTARGIETGMLG